jgi:hypothetical protein
LLDEIHDDERGGLCVEPGGLEFRRGRRRRLASIIDDVRLRRSGAMEYDDGAERGRGQNGTAW